VVVGLDITGKVEFANAFFLELTGYTQAEVLSKDWFETFLPLQEQQQVHTAFQEILEHEFHPHYTNAILTQSGEERIIAWNNTQLRNLQDEVIGTMSIGEDITERHAVEKMKNEFISVVSHELRTPLTSIRGSLGILATGALNLYVRVLLHNTVGESGLRALLGVRGAIAKPFNPVLLTDQIARTLGW
jgi:PAS domain S-box-containing protein